MAPIYDLLTTAGSTLALPLLYVGAWGSPARRQSLRERLGALPVWNADRGIWIQAVSVGEVRQARTLLAGLRSGARPGPVALSSTTAAGREMAGGAGADLVFTFPLDVPWIVRRALDRLSPAAFGTIETELWPGLLARCAARGIPGFLVNGSISERSARRWRWMAGAMREGLGALRAACMQTREDAERILRMGAPPAAVEVTGNMKFDGGAAEDPAAIGMLRSVLGIQDGDPVLVAGSTSAGEEAMVTRAWISARRAFPALRCLIAPRHPARFDEAAREIEREGVRLFRRSAAPSGSRPDRGNILLLDTLGELESAYGLATVAFVGGSLVPRGGQNPLEPARMGVPVLFGPGMESFAEVASGLRGCGAAMEVRDEADLALKLGAFLGDAEARARAAAAGAAFLKAHAGATERTVSALVARLPRIFS